MIHCDQCVNFKPFPRKTFNVFDSEILKYNPCQNGHNMRFKMYESDCQNSNEWGFRMKKCKDYKSKNH